MSSNSSDCWKCWQTIETDVHTASACSHTAVQQRISRICPCIRSFKFPNAALLTRRASAIALRYLLPAEEFLAYKRKLNALIQKAVQENSQITEKALLSLMGFPENWKKVSSYHKV